MSELPADRLVKAYVKIRDRRAELAQEDKELEDKQNKLAMALLDICKETGAESINTKYGTAIRRVQTKYWTSDWDEFFAFMRKHNVMLVQRRIATTEMRQFMEEHPELLPPGLNTESSYAVTVRRK